MTVTDGNLSIPLGTVSWDVAFTAVNANALPVTLSKFYGENINGKNNLYINIATAANIKNINIATFAIFPKEENKVFNRYSPADNLPSGLRPVLLSAYLPNLAKRVQTTFAPCLSSGMFPAGVFCSIS